MEKFIPYEKLSKKEKRKADAAKRSTWGNLNPVTRKPQNSRAYNRKRTQDWKKELPNPASFFVARFQRNQFMKGTSQFLREANNPVCFFKPHTQMTL